MHKQSSQRVLNELEQNCAGFDISLLKIKLLIGQNPKMRRK